MSQFNVGDKVKYARLGNVYYGIIEQITDTHMSVFFGPNTIYEERYGRIRNSYNKGWFSHFEVVESFAYQGYDPVMAKIKKLWNNSNWVLKHPEQAMKGPNSVEVPVPF